MKTKTAVFFSFSKGRVMHNPLHSWVYLKTLINKKKRRNKHTDFEWPFWEAVWVRDWY